MLRKEHIEAILPLASQLDAREIFVGAEGGSPVQLLCTTLCVSQTDVSVVKDGEYSPDVNYLVSLSDGFGDSTRGVYSEHTKLMEDLKTQVAKAVATHLDFAKNTVKPLIVQYHASVAKRVQDYRFDSTEGFKVQIYDLPAPLKFDSLIKEIAETDLSNASTGLESFEIPKPANVLEYVLETATTGDREIDDAVKVWLATKGEAFVSKVYDAAFSKDGFTTLEQLLSAADKFDSAALIFILCRKLMDNPPEGTNYSLGVYNTSILRMQNTVAIRLQGALQEWSNADQLGQVIRYNEDGVIEVYKHIYDQYLNEGGDDTLLMASSIMTKPCIYIIDLQAAQATLRERWSSYSIHAQAVADNNKQTVLKAILREELIGLVNDNLAKVFSNLPGQESTDWSTIQHHQYAPFINVVKTVDEYIACMTEHYLTDLWDACLDIVAKCLFPHTSAHQILSYVHKACVQNPDLPVEEAVFLATNKYVCAYVADQLVIV